MAAGDETWDVIVVGTGIGGATLGHALAKAGKRVLFCEKGRSSLAQDSLRGRYAEEDFASSSNEESEQRTLFARAGRYFDPMDDASAAKTRAFMPLIGCGTGGSSALYGMAMERLFPEDFSPGKHHPDTPGASIVAQWPIAYDDLAPYYDAAEDLYRVHRGVVDPLRSEGHTRLPLRTPALCPANQELFAFFQGKGLHPYHLPMACEYVGACGACQGYLCKRSDCKNDSLRMCLEPAIKRWGATLLDECEVQQLECEGDTVNSVVCNWRGQRTVLQAALVVLAAGALATPTLLLKSASTAWPKGLANGSGLVGKHLMRHYVDLYAVRTQSPVHARDITKGLGLNDLYCAKDQKLGTVQSFGALPPARVLAESLQQEIRLAHGAFAARLYSWVKPIVSVVLKAVLSRKIVLAGIMEDLPYADNQVFLSAQDQRICISYTIRPSERKRIARFRQEVAALLSPYRFKAIEQAENNQRIAHACGTCRFGLDPTTSVLNANNRSHEIKNLYVVDASFFPSSGGTNPSLTIAANALRVADHILSQRPSSQTP